MSTLDPAQWPAMIAYLQRQHTPICRQWFDRLRPGELNGGLLTIHASNTIEKNYLQKQCLSQFTEAAQVITGALVGVQFADTKPRPNSTSRPTAPPQVASALPWAPKVSPEHAGARPRNTAQPTDHASPLDQTVISPDYSFSTFVTGPENALAHSAAVAVTNQPGTTYNPLFIHGGVGLGKTHLLQAICQSLLEKHPTMRLCYLSCDAFVNQFLDCVQKGQMNEFRHQYRHVDLLVIDDIHFLANRERTQEEFFHTFNELHQLKHQIVLSSDSPPHEIPQLEDRLVSRFQSGMVAPVAKPHFETRVAIVRAKAHLRGVELQDDIISYIATKIDSNARELEGAVTTLQGHAALHESPINLTLAQQVLGGSDSASPNSQTTLQHVIDAVTGYYNVRLSDLQSKRRHKSVTVPRQVCMWLARRHTRFSLEEIGGYFGGRDHTTVMHAIRIVDQRIAADADLERNVEYLNTQIANRPSA